MTMRSAIRMKTRRLIFFLLFFAMTGHGIAQDDCGDAAIMSKTGSWKKRADANMRYDKNQVKINRTLDSLGKLFQIAFPEPKGMEAAWYGSMSGSFIPGGPAAYTLNSMYLPWYCNTNLHKMMLSDETGTWAYVFVNSLGWLVSDQNDRASVKVDGAMVYQRPLKKGVWKGFELYQPTAHGAGASCILLTRGNRPILKPVTQEQYLRGWRAFVMDQKNRSVGMTGTSNAGGQDGSDEKEIEHIRNNPNMTPAQKKTMLDAIQKREAMYASSRNGPAAEAGKAKAYKYYDDKLQVIDNYLSHAGKEQLRQPAVIGPKDNGDFSGSFSSEEKGGRMLVTVDSSFFSKDLPTYVPQVMVLYWRWGKDAASQNFRKQFEENFPVDRLRAILDNPAKP